MSWLYNRGGLVKGPVDFAEIEKLIQRRELHFFDKLQYQNEGWKSAYEFESVYELLQKQEYQLEDGRDWVIMHSQEGGGRQQLGPWLFSEVKDALNSGQIKYQDLAWRKGMSRWEKLADVLTMFQPALPEYAHMKKDESLPKQNLGPAKPYLIQSRSPKGLVQAKPLDAEGEDLAQVFKF